MKNFILLLAFILISTVHAGTCTSISRTNSASLSVLTSTKYNTDLNTVYTAANALDGGCITDGTLEDGALNTTDFAALLKGLTQGCKVIYSNASTVQIDKCIASVNGNFVNTTSATNASFGCAGCSSETASTAYYVYIQTGSSGSTLTPLILTTAPNNDGYDNSGNKVLAKFYNNEASNIANYSIEQWQVNKIEPYSSYAFEAYFPITAACTPTRSNTAIGAQTADTDCGSPTVGIERVGDVLTTDANLPRITVDAMTTGVWEIEASVTLDQSAFACVAINVSGTGGGTGQEVCATATAPYTYTAKYVLVNSVIGSRNIEIYTRSASGNTVVRNDIAPVVFRGKVSPTDF